MSKDFFIHRAGTAEIMPDGFHDQEGTEKLARNLAQQNPGVEFYVALRLTRFEIDAPAYATADEKPITHDQPKRLQDQPEPGRVVQSDPPTMHSTLLWTKTTGGAWESGPFTIIERIDGKGWNAGDGTGEAVLMGASLTDCVAACERMAISANADRFRLDLGLVATTIKTMQERLEQNAGGRLTQYDGAVSLARDLYLNFAPPTPPAPGAAILLVDAATQFRKYEAHHRAKNTDESLAKAEVNAEIAGRIESYVDAEAKRDSGARGPAATLGNLLAVIHGDGGHRQAEVGTVEAAREAEEIVTAMRVKAEEAVHAARADAFDDAAAIVARQYKIGGLNLTTMESCMKASWMFSNEAYRLREAAGLPNPGATEYMPAAEERLRRSILGDGAVTPPGHVKMPTSEAEANAMVLLGQAYLKGRAEEKARSQGVAAAFNDAVNATHPPAGQNPSPKTCPCPDTYWRCGVRFTRAMRTARGHGS